MTEKNNGCAYWKLLADGIVVLAWRGGAPIYARKLLLLKGITKAMATKEEYERHRRRRTAKQKVPHENMNLPGWQPQA